MIIKAIPTGAHGHNTRYHIQNERGDMIAWFDSLYEASTVMRYLMGAPMDETDCEAAKTAIQKFDEKR